MRSKKSGAFSTKPISLIYVAALGCRSRLRKRSSSRMSPFTTALRKAARSKEVSCSINMGETTALVGTSGAGKSSLINLICRFYDPSSGRVLIDGIPLPELDLTWWRSQIALVSQDIFLFNASVAEQAVAFMNANLSVVGIRPYSRRRRS